MFRLMHHIRTFFVVCCRYLFYLLLEPKDVKICDACGSNMKGRREYYGMIYKCSKCKGREIYVTH